VDAGLPEHSAYLSLPLSLLSLSALSSLLSRLSSLAHLLFSLLSPLSSLISPLSHSSLIYLSLLRWGPGVDPALPEHSAYLSNLAGDFARDVHSSIVAAAQRAAVRPDAVRWP